MRIAEVKKALRRIILVPTQRFRIKFAARVHDLANLILMDIQGFRSPLLRRPAHWLARRLGDLSWLLPAMYAYKLTDGSCTIVFIGSKEHRLFECCNLFFYMPVEPVRLGAAPLWRIFACIRQYLAQGADLVICESGRCFPESRKTRAVFHSPLWIDQVIDIPERLEELVRPAKNNVRSKLSKAQREGFAYRFSRELADFDYFHHHMYLPFVRSRHAERALLTPYEVQKQFFLAGGLILTTQNGKPVAGELVHFSGDTLCSVECGVLDGSPELMQYGIMPIGRWFALQYAQSMGLRRYNLGGSLSCCSNPTFSAKHRWDAKVNCQREITPYWHFFAPHFSDALLERINRLGFISEKDAKYYRVLIQAHDPGGEIDSELTRARKDGLRGLLIVTPDSVETVETTPTSEEPTVCMQQKAS